MSHTSSGYFMMQIDWSDPRFAPWDTSKLHFNEKQLDAWLQADDDIDFPELTQKQLIKLCLKVPCKVELYHSNVCYGVEKSWPKKMFGKPDFQSLQSKQQQKIYDDMERKAVLLYNKYVSEKRLAERRQRRTNRALAPYHEEIYRRNRFLRIKAMGDEAANTNSNKDKDIDEIELSSDDESEANDSSMRTVVFNTGSTQATSQKAMTDVNDNDKVLIVDDDNEDESPMALNLNDVETESESISTTTQPNKSIEVVDITNDADDDDGDDVDDENNIVAYKPTISGDFVEVFSESIIKSYSESSNTMRSTCATPQLSQTDLHIRTPMTRDVRQKIHEGTLYEPFDDDDDDIDNIEEVDSIDFLSQNLAGLTSTQQTPLSDPVQY